jgi:hypothetical protein
MTYSTLNFNNLVSLRIPSNEEEIRLLKIQTGFESLDWAHSITVLENRTHARISRLIETFKTLPNGATIVDIGAGNSLVDLALASLFREKDFKFILVDTDEFLNSKQYKEPSGPWNPEHYNENGYNPYNDWSFVKNTIKLNDLPLENFSFVHPDNFKECSADVIMSFASYGWHYPLETYLDLITAGLKKNGYLSFMPLMNADNAVDKLNDRFGSTILFEKFNFDPAGFNEKEAEKVKAQIAAGKLHREPFGFHAIWHRTK